MNEKDLTPEEKEKALVEFGAHYMTALVDWKKRHPGRDLPATWSPQLKKYVWVNRADRRRLGVK
jgi:hypothetical protein